MPKLPQVKPTRLLRALQRAGFYIDHITGSHHILYHKDTKRMPISVPRHNRDVKIDTLKSILKQAELSADRLKELL